VPKNILLYICGVVNVDELAGLCGTSLRTITCSKPVVCCPFQRQVATSIQQHAIITIMTRKKLISVDELIQQARQNSIDFGKGNPYNRLRYYTKIGWLPHMIRKKGENNRANHAQGHYPSWALDRLIFIEKLKNKNTTNDEITKKLKKKDTTQTLLKLVQIPDLKTKIIIYVSFVLLVLIFSNEMGLLPAGSPRSRKSTQFEKALPGQIVASGDAFVPKNKNKVFVKTKNISETYKVYITFNNNISPAIRFWVDDKIATQGFYVKLDVPVLQDVPFSWWITN